jgi:hypothetical protein
VEPLSAESTPPASTWDCYFDTSGNESAANSRVLVTAGVVASRDKWARFDTQWLRLLEDAGVRSVHMKEFTQSRGQYADWKGDEPRRAAFLSALLRQAKRGINKTFVTALNVDDYRLLDARFQLTETVGGPYFLAQTDTIGRTFDWLCRYKRPLGRVGFYVAKGYSGQGAFINFMKRVRSFAPVVALTVDEAVAQITPFQVADFIACEFRYAYDKQVRTAGHRVPRRSLTELRRLLPVDASVFDARRIEQFCERHVPSRND